MDELFRKRKEELRRKMEEERARSFHQQQESQGFFKNRQYGGQQREYRQNWGPNVNDND